MARMVKGKVLAFINFKGGVGKTTLAASIGRAFVIPRPLKVLIIDLDPQFNLTQLLLTRKMYEDAERDGRIAARLFRYAMNSIPASSQATAGAPDPARVVCNVIKK